MEETVIKPRSKLSLNFNELKAYRELFFYFAWRDIKVRYKQSVLGISWAILQPLAMMIVFTLFFNRVAKIDSGAVPYAIFSYTGLLFWNYFSSALTRSSQSLVANQGVITKIYFPRIITPISATLVGLVDFFFAFLVFLALMFYFSIAPGIEGVIFLVPAVIITFLASSGLGMFFSAVNVKYRDIQQIVPFLVQLGLFLTPIIYPVSMIPERFQWILYLNPITGVISGMRNWWLHQGEVNMSLLSISIVSAMAMFIFGYVYFKRKEREFADII